MENGKKHELGWLTPAAILAAAVICLLVALLTNQQAVPSVRFPLQVTGAYSCDRGATWQPLTQELQIPARQRELWIRGHLSSDIPAGQRLYYYKDHLGVSIYQNGEALFLDTATQCIQQHLTMASVCGRTWDYILSPGIFAEDEIEFRLVTPHTWLRQNSYREFLSMLYVESDTSYLLELRLQRYSAPQAGAGALLVLSSLLLLGAAIASRLMRTASSEPLFNFGMTLLFGGSYFLLDIISLSFWIDLVAFNTCARQLCMMLGVYFMQRSAICLLREHRRLASAAVRVSAWLDVLLLVLVCIGVLLPYDTTPYWCAMQFALCLLLLVCTLRELRRGNANNLRLGAAALLCCALLLDMLGLGRTFYSTGTCTKLVLLLVFAVQLVQTVQDVVLNYQARQRADALEKELEDSRISVMLSQLQPHFMYNVLNSIYYLCKRDPDMARDMVDKFSDYLRNNMAALEEKRLIPFDEEYQHIQTYLSLEHIRFQDMLHVVYDIECTDFYLPPLTVQPLVENAVRHGITTNEHGGTVTLSTRETETAFVITVADTGTGFDPAHYMEDGRVHIGIRSVRKRLSNMVHGTLCVTSSPGAGTTAVITIPKEEERS